MINKEILNIIEKYIGDKKLTYQEYLQLLSDERINNYFMSVLNNRNSITQKEINTFSKSDSVNELFSTFLEIHDIAIKDEYDSEDYSDDMIKQYIMMISKYPLLNFKQEQELFRKFSDHLEELRNDETINTSNGLRIYLTDEEKTYYDQFVNSNYRLVVYYAKKYVNRGLPLMDLIQEGNMGLLKAVEKFDVNRGFKFSSYASYWIKQHILRGLANDGRTIRTPVYLVTYNNEIKKIMADFYNKNGRYPSKKEIAILYLGYDENNLTNEQLIEIETNIQKMKELEVKGRDLISLDMNIGEEEDTSLLELIPDESYNLEDIIMDENLKESVHDILDLKRGKLNEREATILKYRFGLVDGKQHTLEEIGKEYNLTRERIRQIESRALRKLRSDDTLRTYAKDLGLIKKSVIPYDSFRIR